MTLQGVLHDCQAQPGSSKFPRASRIDPEESFGHPRNEFLRDADPGVLYEEGCTIVVSFPAHLDGTVGRREAHSVTHQVVKDRMHFGLAPQQREIGADMH